MGCNESKPEVVDIPSGANVDDETIDEIDENVEEAAQLLISSNAFSTQIEVYLLNYIIHIDYVIMC